jgi:hypothetical protein
MAASTHALRPEIRDSIEQLRDISTRVDKLFSELAPEQLTGRPEPGKWSIAEHVAHLTLTSKAYDPLFEEAFARARRENMTGGDYSMELMPRLLKWYLEPPYRSRMKTPPAFVPAPEVGSVREVITEFLNHQEKLQVYFREASQWDLSRLKIKSPFAKQVQYNLFSAIQLILAHERRHVWAAEQLRSRMAA